MGRPDTPPKIGGRFSKHWERQNPRHSRCMLNLPPILGGVSGRARSSTPPSHTPMSAIVLGSSLLGSTLLGSSSQGHPFTCSPLHGSGGPTSSQGGSTNPPSPPQGSSSQHTMARANPPPHCRCHIWPLSTYRISANSPMILYCMIPHGLQCPPNYLRTYQRLKERPAMTLPTMS